MKRATSQLIKRAKCRRCAAAILAAIFVTKTVTSPSIAERFTATPDGHLPPLNLAGAEAFLLHVHSVEGVNVEPAPLGLKE
jgi:hypothetical protein